MLFGESFMLNIDIEAFLKESNQNRIGHTTYPLGAAMGSSHLWFLIRTWSLLSWLQSRYLPFLSPLRERGKCKFTSASMCCNQFPQSLSHLSLKVMYSLVTLVCMLCVSL